MPTERVAPTLRLPVAPGGNVWQRLRANARVLGALLVGAAAVLGSIAAFRQVLLPLIDAVFHPGAVWFSIFRRSGIILAALAGYWAFVHWFEKRPAMELQIQPIRLMLGGVSGAAMVAFPIAVLFVLGAYELVLLRNPSSSLFGVAVVIAIAATLEELAYRCLLFRLLERAWGTSVALVVQALVFAIGHLENVEQGGLGVVVTMLVTVTVMGMFWAGLFILTRNLWVGAAHHAAWNFTILLSGMPLSGIEDWRKMAPLESRYAGPDWLTGGMFGPESSWLVIGFAAISVMLLLRVASQRGAFLKAM